MLPRDEGCDNELRKRQHTHSQLAVSWHPDAREISEIDHEDVLAKIAVQKIEFAKEQGLEDVKLKKIEWEALQRKIRPPSHIPDVDSPNRSTPSPKLMPAFNPSSRPSPLPSPSIQATSASVHTFPFRSSSPVRPSLSPTSSAPSSLQIRPSSAHSRPRLDFPALVRTSTDPLSLSPASTQNRTPSPTRAKELELVDMPRGYSPDSVRERRKRWENQS